MAGEWRRVAQAITPTTFLLETPLPAGADVIAISDGFVGDLYQGNVVDSRGGLAAMNLVLAGNHYGTRVINNKLLGAGVTFQITAYPTESPMTWGWSHVPYFGGVIERNVIEDADRGGILSVLRSEYTKSSRGRVYMTTALRNNTFRWTESFLKGRVEKGSKELPKGITIGSDLALDPNEQVIETAGNRLEAPAGVRAPALRVESGLINGHKIVGRSFELSATTAGGGKNGARKEKRSPARGNR